MLQTAWDIITLHVNSNRKEKSQVFQWQAVSSGGGFGNTSGTSMCFRGFVGMGVSGKNNTFAQVEPQLHFSSADDNLYRTNTS